MHIIYFHRKKNINGLATIKWVIQTFIYGLFSISKLSPYEPHATKFS